MYKIFLIIFLSFFVSTDFSLCAEYYGSVNRSYSPHVYSKNDVSELIKKGDFYLKKYETTSDKVLKQKYLKEALRFYYICTKSDYSNIDGHIGLGKAYDEMSIDRYAKLEFNFAYNINNKNPKLNYRFGDFYYKRRQYSMAQHYFTRAYNFGYANNPDLNFKMASSYIKLAEPSKAQNHLQLAKKYDKTKSYSSASLSKEKKSAPITTKAIISSKTDAPIISTPKSDYTSVNNISFEKENYKVSKLGKTSPSRPKIKNVILEDAVLKANDIKMIDDIDRLKPMYYLFIK